MKTLAILCACLLAGSGCASLKYQEGGAKFSRLVFGSKTAISELQVVIGTNGTKTIILKGYANDQVEAIRTAVDAAVSAAVKSAVPVQ